MTKEALHKRSQAICARVTIDHLCTHQTAISAYMRGVTPTLTVVLFFLSPPATAENADEHAGH